MRFGFVFCLSLVIGACSSAGGGTPQPGTSNTPSPTDRASSPYEEATVRAAATIRAEDIRANIAFLASDELAGRDTPSPGLEAAAEFLVDRLQEAGLEPGGDDGTFIQRFPYTRTTMRTSARMASPARPRRTKFARNPICVALNIFLKETGCAARTM